MTLHVPQLGATSNRVSADEYAYFGGDGTGRAIGTHPPPRQPRPFASTRKTRPSGMTGRARTMRVGRQQSHWAQILYFLTLHRSGLRARAVRVRKVRISSAWILSPKRRRRGIQSSTASLSRARTLVQRRGRKRHHRHLGHARVPCSGAKAARRGQSDTRRRGAAARLPRHEPGADHRAPTARSRLCSLAAVQPRRQAPCVPRVRGGDPIALRIGQLARACAARERGGSCAREILPILTCTNTGPRWGRLGRIPSNRTRLRRSLNFLPGGRRFLDRGRMPVIRGVSHMDTASPPAGSRHASAAARCPQRLTGPNRNRPSKAPCRCTAASSAS